MNRHHHTTALLALLILSLFAFTGITTAQQQQQQTQQQEETNPAVAPVPRDDDWWKQRQEMLNQRVQENPDAQLLFIGDSITHGWEGAGKEVWQEYYGDRNAINLGIGGDRTQHVLWRLENGNIEGISPEAAVIMIGTNNGGDDSAPQIADGVTAIVDKLHAELPDMQVLLLAIFPRGEHVNDLRGKLLQTNQILQKLDSRDYVHYLDIGHHFIDENGDLPKGIMPDFLHLSPEGYEIWAKAIEDELAKLLEEN